MGLEDVFPDFAGLKARGFAGIACTKPAIMIAMTPRTGSTYLCTALHQAGQSVEPWEIFNAGGPAQKESRRRATPLFADYIASFAADPDAAFIFKTGWHNAEPLAPYLTALFPDLRVIYLDRKNIAAQAVSQFRAQISGLWHRRPGQAEQTFDPTGRFDLAHINGIIKHNLQPAKQSWEDWFAAHHITPLRLDYRELEADMEAVLRHIVSAMHLPLRTELPQGAGVLKLADGLSAEWTERVQKHLLNMS